MKVNALVIGDRQETWFKGEKDERNVRVLTLLDSDKDGRLENTFDYRIREEEAKSHPAGSLDMQPITVLVRSIKPAKGGRLVFIGAIANGNGAGPKATAAK